MPSKYSDVIPLIVRDIHNLLNIELNLPTTFKSADPEPGEAYGLLSCQNLRGEIGSVGLTVSCTFIASATYATYWEAATWAISTAMNLDNLLPQIKTRVDKRGVLNDFSATSAISIGRPRAPLKAIQGQKSHSWVVDVMLLCAIELAIYKDLVCGHL